MKLGVGLGLAIVRRLTLLLGHSLTVRSELGEGSLFQIGAPYADPAAVIGCADRRVPLARSSRTASA